MEEDVKDHKEDSFVENKEMKDIQSQTKPIESECISKMSQLTVTDPSPKHDQIDSISQVCENSIQSNESNQIKYALVNIRLILIMNRLKFFEILIVEMNVK
jgi:hypothetical protein